MSVNKKNKLKIITFSLICLGLSSILAVALAEGILRIFSEYLPEGVQLRIHWQALGREGARSIAHPYIGFLYPPNSPGRFERGEFKFTFHTDAYGFRNKNPWPERADIVVVGDSLAFGYGVNDEQSWTARVDKQLPNLSILNLGLIGASPQQYQRVYEVFGATLKPKLLIMGLFPDNDFWDAKKFDQWLRLGAKGNYDSFRLFGNAGSGAIEGLKGIIKKTYIYALLLEGYCAFNDKRLFKGKTIIFPDGGQLQLVPGRLQEQIDLMRSGELGFDLTVEAILNTKKLASRSGTHLLVLIFPSKEAVYMQNELKEDILHPLKMELERLDINYLDLTRFFRADAMKGERLFFKVDGHPNQRGYQIVADVLIDHLQKKYSFYGFNEGELVSSISSK